MVTFASYEVEELGAYMREDLDSALRAAEEAKGKPEVLWATVEVAEGESGEE